MRVLFCTEKWADSARPELGNSVHEYGIVGSLASSGSGVILTFHYDQFAVERPRESIDEALVLSVRQSKPDVLVATMRLQDGERNVKPATYGYIRDEMGIPVAMVWFESAPDVVRHADMYAPEIDANVFVDSTEYWKQWTKHPAKSHFLFEPRDTALFNSGGGKPRDIPLSFVGTTFRRLDRCLNLGFLWGNGVPVIQLGGQGSGLSPTDYADVLRRSLMTVNFSSAVTFQQIKGRVTEAMMCGAMVLDSENRETAQLYEPFVEYVPFSEYFHLAPDGAVLFRNGDLMDKARYYMAHADKAREIAEAGNRAAMQKSDGKMFWAWMFELLGRKEKEGDHESSVSGRSGNR